MEIEKIFNYMKVPHIFKDIIFLLLGINFLFFINCYYAPSVDNIPNFNYINNFILSILFLSIAYAIGRVLKIIADIWLDLCYLLFKENLKEYIRIKYNGFLEIVNKKPHPIMPDLTIINHDVECFIQGNNYLRDVFERKVYHDTFMSGLLGTSIVITIITTSNIFFLIAIVITFLIVLRRIKDRDNKIEIAGSFIRNKTIGSNMEKK